LREILKSEHFAVDTAQDGERGSYIARTNEYDLLILDNRMPGKSGRSVCEELRAAGKTMPILVLSAVTNTQMKIELLNAGADDYLAKPFSFEELLARIRALLRRPLGMMQETLAVDTLSLNTRTHDVRRGKSVVTLTRKEYMLLAYLMRNEGSVLSRGMLMEHVWEMHMDPFSNTVESHILSLRRKVEKAGQRKLIHTLPGRGYKISS
jgi:DNA-binding response OmpR family regulator